MLCELSQPELPSEFVAAWRSAGTRLQAIGQGAVAWIRSTLMFALAEHLSFRLGNQLFFVYVDVDAMPFEGQRRKRFLEAAREATAIACVMRMERRGGGWVPEDPGWGLIDAVSRREVDPPGLVSDELVEMSDWELHDFAIQIVRSHLKRERKRVCSVMSSLHADPSIWFEDERARFWVVVRAARFPAKAAARPANMEEIGKWCSGMSPVGFFASVSLASADDAFASGIVPATPMYRGHAIRVRFAGLEPA
jgi:hypothetical protein